MDYLGAVLNEWFDHENRNNFILKNSNSIIGFFSLTWYRDMAHTRRESCPLVCEITVDIFENASIEPL